MDNKHALVLAGGGARGSYQIGVWQALRELDWPIHIVTGTSVGALNGAMVVQDQFDSALQMWSRLETGMVLDMDQRSVDQMKKGLFGTIGVFARELITRGGAGYSALQSIVNDFVAEESVRASPRELGIVTVELLPFTPRKLFREDIEPGKLNDYLLASAACFPAFHSYEIDRVKYIDGAYWDNMPIQMALDKGADYVVAVDLHGMGVTNRALASSPNVTLIQSCWDLGSFLLFDQNNSRRNIRLGYLDAMRAFEVYDGRAFAFVRGSLPRMIRQEKEAVSRLLQAAGADVSCAGPAANRLRRMILEKNLAYYTGRSLNVENLLLSCAESAGRIFDLDPLILYSMGSFREHLLGRVGGTPASHCGGLGESFSNLRSMPPNHMQAFLQSFSSKGISLTLAALLQDKMDLGSSVDYGPLGALFPKEYAAALFLVLCGADPVPHLNKETE